MLAEEEARKKAIKIVADQRSKSESDFTESDRRLVSHIAKNILQSKVLSGSSDGLIYRLARVERDILLRAKKRKSDKDLPDDTRAVVEALKKVMSHGGQAIAQLRRTKTSGLDESDAQALASELEEIATKLKDLLDGPE
jgi:hypothetical protein